jgi:PAS domain S-box-containing protein
MNQKETQLDRLFREFQSSFDLVEPEEKKRLATQYFPWVEQQVSSFRLPAVQHSTEIKYVKHETKEQRNSQQENAINTLLQKLLDGSDMDLNLNQIAENIEQVFWLRDVTSDRVIYASPAFETVWEISCRELYANPYILIESVHPEDRLQVMVTRPSNDHKPFTQVYRIYRPDGSLRWISAHTFLIKEKVGALNYVFCIAQDITDQKLIELALRKTLDRTREQFDLSRKMSLARKPEAVLRALMSAEELRTAQRAALLFFENPKAGPTHGVELTASWVSSQNSPPWQSESSLYEEPALVELLSPSRTVVINEIQSDPRLTPVLRDLLLEGHIRTLVLFPLIASGDWLGCLSIYYTQEHQFNHIELRHLKILVDQATITLYNLQLLEVEEESRHEAERANEIKTEFLAMISHELRTPLTSIIGFTTTLLAKDVNWEPEEQHDFIKTIQQEADRLQELIDHLLDLSRLEAGMLPISPEPHSLFEITEDALPQLHTLTIGKTFIINLPDTLPLINVDPKRIAQVLVNLVRNAATYAPDGTEISLTANVRGEFVLINVNDQGPGIPVSEHRKVFKAFQRGKNIEHGSLHGAGLGLAICKGLIEAHGGRIWIKKKTTPGTTISFTVPMATLHTPVLSGREEI